MDKNPRECIGRIMEEVAVQNGMTGDELYQCIRSHIAHGIKSKDPAVRAFWRRIPAVANQPTPEEAVGYIAAVRLGLIGQ